MPASIEIDAPLTGSNVPQSFIAVGTYVADAGAPEISVSMSAAGSTVSDVRLDDPEIGCWACDINVPTAGSDYTLTADISDGTSDSDEQTDITVDGTAPIGMDPLDPLDPPPPGPMTETTLQNYEVSGRHRGNVKHIIVTAVIFANGANGKKRIESVEAVAIGHPDTPAPGRWKAVLSINPLAAGKKLGVLAIGLSQKGEVLGKAFRRRK